MLGLHLNRSAKIMLTVILVVLILAGFATLYVLKEERNRATEADRDINQLALEDGTSPFRDLYGRPYDVPSYQDSILVLTTWASWCASCENDLNRFEKIAAEYGKDVRILAVNRKEPDVMVRNYAKRFSKFEHVTLIIDERDHFFEAVDGNTMPETVFYDYEGEVYEHVRMPLSKEEIKNIIEEIKNQ